MKMKSNRNHHQNVQLQFQWSTGDERHNIQVRPFIKYNRKRCSKYVLVYTHFYSVIANK